MSRKKSTTKQHNISLADQRIIEVRRALGDTIKQIMDRHGYPYPMIHAVYRNQEIEGYNGKKLHYRDLEK